MSHKEQVKAIEQSRLNDYARLSRLIEAGAFSEDEHGDCWHCLPGEEPGDATALNLSKHLDDLEFWALEQGKTFVYHPKTRTAFLEDASAEQLAAYREAMAMREQDERESEQ